MNHYKLLNSFFLALLIIGSMTGKVARADANACDDYLARHYKTDFKPIGLSFQSREYMGDIRMPHQIAWIRLKSVGEMDFSATPSGYRDIRASVKYNEYATRVNVPAPSGSERVISVILPPGTLRHCEKARVEIDLTHSVGQWGCQVWNNDVKMLRARESNKSFLSCYQIVRPPIGPIVPIRPIQPIRR